MQITGTCIVRVDGLSYRSKPGAELDFGGFERPEVVADGRISGYAETPVAPMVTVTFAHASDTDVIVLRDARDVSIIFECDSGPRYLMRGSWASTPPKLTGGEGDLACEFKGIAVEQV